MSNEIDENKLYLATEIGKVLLRYFQGCYNFEDYTKLEELRKKAIKIIADYKKRGKSDLELHDFVELKSATEILLSRFSNNMDKNDDLRF